MKITHVEPVLVALPYEDGGPERETSPGHSSDTVLALFVKVETDEGITGWGEAFSFATVPVTIPAIADMVGPLAVGQERPFADGSTIDDAPHPGADEFRGLFLGNY